MSLLKQIRCLLLRKNRPSMNICRSFSKKSELSEKLRNGPSFSQFISPSISEADLGDQRHIPYIENLKNTHRKVFFDVYGCQMNVNDTEIVWSILKDDGYTKTEDPNEADVFLVMTCAIREGAEAKIWHRLDHLKGFKRRRTKLKNRVGIKIGVLGCMAERLKAKLIETEKSVDVVAGPDSYRDLPRLLALTDNDQAAVNVLLSLDETYADVMPVRLNQDSVTAFVSIMRGCDNMCTYCIVPWTRGRERSRPPHSVVEEVSRLAAMGVREVTLLGQNVNSYRHLSEGEHKPTQLAKGFRTVYKNKQGGLRFADLLARVSAVDPNMRIRFTSPHPKDFPDEVLQVISERDNICKSLHLPAQSGSSAVLERMRRGYTREAYLDLVDHARDVIRGVALSSDFICGFCGETDQEFLDTLTLIERVGYNVAYLFPYSMREKTTAHRRYTDDVPDAVKRDRHRRMVEVYRRGAEALNMAEVGNTHLVLIEGASKKSEQFLAGKNDHGIKVILGQMDLFCPETGASRPMRPGDFVAVEILEANSQVMKGRPLRFSSITDFSSVDCRRETSL